MTDVAISTRTPRTRSPLEVLPSYRPRCSSFVNIPLFMEFPSPQFRQAGVEKIRQGGQVDELTEARG